MKDVELQTREIIPKEITVEERNGREVVSVIDGNGKEYSSIIDYIVNVIRKRKDRYLDSKWRIAFRETDKGYNHIYSFLFPVPKKGKSRLNLQQEVKRLKRKIEKLED